MKPEDITYQKKIVPDCYHGTDGESASKIKSDSCFLASTGDKQFLGDGVYFFEGDVMRAQEWGRDKAKRLRTKFFSVFLATVDLGACLDLSIDRHRDIVYYLREKIIARGVYKITDAVVINYLAKITILDCVKCVYAEKSPLYPGSRIPARSKVVVCVRNPARIEEFVEYLREEA